MSDLEKLQDWIQSFPGAERISNWKIDYTDQIPGTFGMFPTGLIEISRKEDVLGNVTVRNQYNFALYLQMYKAPGDEIGALYNADWVIDFQRWVQEQSILRKAPTFGNHNTRAETITASNGALLDASEEGTALYMVQLTATFENYYEA